MPLPFDSNQSFSAQQSQATQAKHPAQKAASMTDKEKIHHLKNEINNLRSQLGQETLQATNPATAATSQSAQAFPLFTILLLVGVALVAVWRKRRSTKYLRGGSSLPGATAMMALELQDAAFTPDTQSTPNMAYRAPEGVATVSFV